MNTTPKIHNPDNLTPEQYGAADGWRLMYVGEQTSTKDQFWSWSEWKQDHNPGPIQSYHATCRTRTPDPYAPDSGWIKMSERKPTEADVPFAYVTEKHYTREHGVLSGVVYDKVCLYPADALYWVKLPAPPSRELTQAEKDREAFDEWEAREPYNPYMHSLDVWREAIAYERAEIAKMMTIGPGSWLSPLWKKIEARVKGAQ